MNEWNTGDTIDIVQLTDMDEVGTGGKIYLSPEVMGVIRKLCEDIKVEWQMLLTGEVKDGNAYGTGYWIPKQRVSAASVHNLELVDAEVIAERKIIAGIHSHADMGVFFSTTDEVYTNQSLIERNIVVNNKYEFTAVTRWNLPNNRVCFLKAQVVCRVDEVDNVEGFENIEVNNVSFTTQYPIVGSENRYNPTKGRYYQKSKHALCENYTDEQFDEAVGGLYDDVYNP